MKKVSVVIPVYNEEKAIINVINSLEMVLKKNKTLSRLEANDIIMVGRYGRWRFQGITDSIKDGLCMGATLK